MHVAHAHARTCLYVCVHVCVLAGELDGARMALGLWGRRTAGVVSLWTQLVLGFSAIFGSNALSFTWLLLIVFLLVRRHARCIMAMHLHGRRASAVHLPQDTWAGQCGRAGHVLSQ